MDINRDLIIKRFDKLNELLEIFNEFKGIPKNKFLSNSTLCLSAQRALEISINICIDVGAHILSIYNNEKPETYSVIFERLEKLEIINNERKDTLIKMVKFRNLLGHLYMEIDNSIVYDIIQNNLNDFKLFNKDIFSKFKKQLMI